MFFKISVLNIFAYFTGEHLCCSLFFYRTPPMAATDQSLFSPTLRLLNFFSHIILNSHTKFNILYSLIFFFSQYTVYHIQYMAKVANIGSINAAQKSMAFLCPVKFPMSKVSRACSNY